MWKTVVFVIIGSIAGVIGLLVIAANWPLPDGVWWGVAAAVVVGIFNHETAAAKDLAESRHIQILEKLRRIEKRVGADVAESWQYDTSAQE